MDVIRLVTVHPLLVHLTIGLIPALLVAYAIAVWRRSEHWTFVGDVVTVFAALVTVATFAFGLVSNAVLDWPGGIGVWRWLHLGFGAATALLLLVFAGARIAGRGRRPVAGAGTVAVALGVAVLGGFTGWIGGEVLVYHSGMAVTAAGEGALAPPLGVDAGPPKGFHDAMGKLRSAWAGSQIELAQMVVDHPTQSGFAAIVTHGQRLEFLGRWLYAEAPKLMGGGHDASSALEVPLVGPARAWAAEGDAGGGAAAAENAEGAEAGDAEARGGEKAEGKKDRKKELIEAGHDLEDRAQELVAAARAQDLKAVARSVGRTTEVCADCHLDLRWKHWSASGPTAGSAGD